MTGTAIVRGRNMIDLVCLAGGNHAIVARRAVTDDAGMVINRAGESSGVTVTIFTGLRGGHMIRGLADSDKIIVTGRATAGDAGMIINAGGKITRRVTIDAIAGNRHMIGGQASDTIYPVVTGCAGACREIDGGMVNESRGKAANIMTVTAIRGRINMAIDLAPRPGAVVTGSAGLGNIAVIEKRRLEIIRNMTGAAISFRRYMGFMFAGGDNTIVAHVAAVTDPVVIELAVGTQFQKVFRIMAIVTFNRSFDVTRRFAYSKHAVMTITATAENFFVVNIGIDGITESGMTGLTEIRGWYVVFGLNRQVIEITAMTIGAI